MTLKIQINYIIELTKVALTKKLDGSYTKMLRFIFMFHGRIILLTQSYTVLSLAYLLWSDVVDCYSLATQFDMTILQERFYSGAPIRRYVVADLK